LCLGLRMGAAQTTGEHRQAYLALIYHVRPADMEKFVQFHSLRIGSTGVNK
jgi:hypothetical protein